MPLQLTESCSPIEFTNPDEDVDACIACLDALECGPSPFATNNAGFDAGSCGALQPDKPGVSGEGEECVVSECGSGLDASPCSACTPVQCEGQTCADDYECAAGLFCDTDTCQSLLADGSTCSTDGACCQGGVT